MRFTRITIIRATKPSRPDINDELQWFGGSLGLFSLRDKDKSRFRIFIVLVKSLKANKPLSSDEIAELTKLTRGTVIFHLNSLMQSGIVTSEKNKYMLNVRSLEELVDLVQDNLKKTFDDLREIARDIDERLEL